MDLFGNLFHGLTVAASFHNLLYCLLGVTLGTLIGVLPGVGALTTISVLLPITFYLPPVPSIIMLSGIYYGAMYGGSTTAIMINIPGMPTAAVSCLDGYPMAQQGRAGPALVITTIASFFAGCIATAIIALFAPPLAEIALSFGSVEYFSLMVLGLVAAIILASKSLIKAIGMVLFGLLLGIVGLDVTTGQARFSFGVLRLVDGINLVVIAVGLFGIAEIISKLERDRWAKRAEVIEEVGWSDLIPSKKDLNVSWWPMIRGTTIGAILGVLPGAGATMSSFASYAVEKRLAKDPSQFGKGAIQGLAGPESANNAAAQTSFIPTLTLGIPGSATMALMLGAMTMFGISPGPHVMVEQPDLFWGLIVSMWIGNLMLLILNLPMVGIWVRLLMIPYRILYPSILMLACVGIYSVSNSTFDVVLSAGFGLLGYAFMKLGCEVAPLILAFILGPLMEEHLRRAMLISRGDATVFLTSPISLIFLIASAVLLFATVAPALRKTFDAVVAKPVPAEEGDEL